MIQTIGTDHLRATIAPMGAEMQTLTWRGQDLLWNGDAAYWTGRAPVLFPIVGRADNDTIAVDGRVATMKQHGFARRLPFELVQADEGQCTFSLRACDETRTAYPFEFTLLIRYTIAQNRLTVEASVQNDDSRPMPFGFGFHPAFVWPLPQATGAHRITLTNGANPLLARLRDGLLGTARLPSPFQSGTLTLAHDQFVDDAMIFPEGAGTGVVYAAETGPRLTFRFENLPNLALWQKPGAPFICIEPWHGMTALAGAGPEISDRPFSQILSPGAQARFAYSVTVD